MPSTFKWNSVCWNKKQCCLYVKAVFPHCKAAWVQRFDLCAVCVGMFFFFRVVFLTGLAADRSWFSTGRSQGKLISSKANSHLRAEAFHWTRSTCGKWVTLKWKMELFTQSSLWTEQLHGSPVCAVVAPIALDVLWLVPLTVPTLLTLSQHDSQKARAVSHLGIPITCTLHIPHYLEYTRLICPDSSQGAREGFSPCDESAATVTSSGSELLKAFFCACVYNCKCRWSVCQFCDCEVQTAARGFPPSARCLTHQYKHTHNTFSHKGAYPQNPPLMEATAVFSQVFMHSSV